jgi:hypothetical protein
MHAQHAERRQSLSRAEAVRIFEQIDANGNGEISQIEFIKALRKDTELAKRLGLPRYSVYLLYWYRRPNADAGDAPPCPAKSGKRMKAANCLRSNMQISTRTKARAYRCESSLPTTVPTTTAVSVLLLLLLPAHRVI